MVDLGELAVPRDLDGRNGNVGVALDRQLEDRAVICFGAAERPNDYTGVDWVGEMEELEGEFLLGLRAISYVRWRGFLRSHTNSSRDLPFSLTVNG